MSLAHDLLIQARHLLTVDQSRPRQASLRRAVSTAYYAVFHLLLSDAAEKMSPRSPAVLHSQFARAFQHGEMKQICQAVQTGSRAFALQKVQPAGFSPALRAIASSFVSLQDERHRADYDTGFKYLRQEVEAVVQRAEALFALWAQVRVSDESNVFCVALLLGTRWGR